MTALKTFLIYLLLISAIVPTKLNAQRSEYLAIFPRGVVYLPTVNYNNVVVKYNSVLGGVSKEAVFYPRGDTLAVYQLDTCKREFIALSWAFDALEQRHIDSLVVYQEKVNKMSVDNSKQVRKANRKGWFRGFLWGVPVGIISGVLAFVR